MGVEMEPERFRKRQGVWCLKTRKKIPSRAGLSHLILLGSSFTEEKPSNNSIDCLQVPVSNGIVLRHWKSMPFCFLGNREELGRAGSRRLNTVLLSQTLLVLLLLGAACHPESISGMFKTESAFRIGMDLPSSYTHLKSGCSWRPFQSLADRDDVPRLPRPRCLQPSMRFGVNQRSWKHQQGAKRSSGQVKANRTGVMCQIHLLSEVSKWFFWLSRGEGVFLVKE